MRELNPNVEIIGKACPLFAHIVEEGWENSDLADLTTQKYLLEFKEHNIDTLIMGCTHYPALRYTLSKFFGEGVKLVNPAYETAKEAKRMLIERNELSDKIENGSIKYYVSDDPEKFKRVGGNLLGREIPTAELINIDKF